MIPHALNVPAKVRGPMWVNETPTPAPSNAITPACRVATVPKSKTGGSPARPASSSTGGSMGSVERRSESAAGITTSRVTVPKRGKRRVSLGSGRSPGWRTDESVAAVAHSQSRPFGGRRAPTLATECHSSAKTPANERYGGAVAEDVSRGNEQPAEPCATTGAATSTRSGASRMAARFRRLSGRWSIGLVTADVPGKGHRLHPADPGGHPESNDSHQMHESKRLTEPADASSNG